jgi:CRP-like cAMP-binding protein
MTHQELADELGAARETTSRILKKLELESKLKLHRGWIEIIENT